MDNILDFRNFDVLKTVFSDESLRQNTRLLCVYGCGAAEVLYATVEDRVYGFGRNRFGGLGLGTADVEIKEPQFNTTLSFKQLTDIFIGFEHWLGLTANGKCYAWGHNHLGQLGIGSDEETSTPTLVDQLAEVMVKQISCGGFHTLALTIGGQVYAWGDNQFGQLGDYSYTNRLSPIKISVPEEVVSISCGKKHSLALTVGGLVYLWGINGYGQCGRSPTKYETINIPLIVTNLKTIRVSKAICGPNHTLLLTADGNIYSFGENTVGQVGDGTVEHQYTPIRIREDTKFTDIISNKENDLSFAISKAGNYYVWGLAKNRRYMTPKELPLSDITGMTILDIYAKYAKNKITYKSIETNNDLKRNLQNTDEVNQLEVSDENNEVVDSLNEDLIYSQSCKRGKTALKSRRTIDELLNLDHFLKNKSLIDDDMKRSIRLLYVFGIYGSKVIFVTNEDKVYAFGHNRDGCLGIGTTGEHILNLVLNETLSGKYLADISSGYEHCIGLTGSGQCYGWGVNKYGQLGIGNIENQTSPQLITDLTDKTVVAIACGSYHSMALTSEGDLFSWGHNTFAQLGDRTYNSRETPTQVLISGAITSISCGINHSLALTSTGLVYVWGVNESGQLGRERHHDLRKGRDKAMSNRPKLIPGLENVNFAKAVCGPNHSLLLTTDGHLYVFGDNTSGQIGNGSTDTQFTPYKLNKNILIKDIVTCFRDDLSIAVSTNNNAFVWGMAMDEKVLRPRPIPPSFGRSLFNMYVTLAKNKVTFKAVNVYEDFDRFVIKEKIISNQLDVNMNECKDSSDVKINNEKIINTNIDPNEEFNRFHELQELCEEKEDLINKMAAKKADFGLNGQHLVSYYPSNHTIINGVNKGSEPMTGQIFLRHLHNSFNNVNNYDLIINSGVKIIYCHKTILQIRNQKFWQLLRQNMKDESPPQIPINPESYHSFYAFIQYIYGMEPEIDVRIISDLEKMADYFVEPELKELCAQRYQRLKNTIDLTNVCAFYETAIKYKLEDLEKSCLQFAANNWKTILRSDAFQAMDDFLSKKLMLSIHN